MLVEWKNIAKGIMMGITELVPGISSSTVAMILGIYEGLISALSGLTTREWKSHLGFLIPLGLGMVIALLVFSGIIEWLLLTYPKQTLFFFLGLVFGVVPFLLKSIQFRENFHFRHYVFLGIAAFLVVITGLFRDNNNMTEIMTNLSMQDYILLFGSGWAASTFMVLPGISGALVFLFLGVYPTIINALHTLNFPVIISVGLGIVIGVLVTSKIIRLLFSLYRISTYAVIIGLILGSAFVIYQHVPGGDSFLLSSIVTFLLGFFFAITLGRVHN